MKKYCFYFIFPIILILLYFPLRALADNRCKTVYLTFDDCPTAYTEKMLDILAAHGDKATFFVLKVYADARPELVERMYNEGHGVGLHGVGHDKEHFYQTELSPLWEMDELKVSLFQLTGEDFHIARTPFGSLPSLTRAQYQRLINGGYILWDWNVDTKDAIGASVSPEKITRRAIDGIIREDTPVILMHNMRASALALPTILDYIDEMGYKTATLNQTKMQPICFMDP